MKWLLFLVLAAGGSFAAGLFFPWWSLAPICFVAAVLTGLKGGSSFLAGFLAIGLLWFVLAWWRNLANDAILATRMSQLFFHRSNPYLVMGLSACLGGWVGGISALAGSLIRVRRKPRLQSMGDFLRNRT